MNRKIIMLPLSLAAVFSLVACGGNQDSSSNTSSSSETTTSSASSSNTEVVTISVSKSSVSLEVGGTEVITATVSGSNNTNKVWSSSDTSVATVTAGLITAVKAGTCTITVAAEADSTVKATISVTVNEKVNVVTATTVDALAGTSGLSGKTLYRATGIIEGMKGDKYGNAYLTDPTSGKTVQIYGLTGTNDESCFDFNASEDSKFFNNPKDAQTSLANVKNGDLVTVKVGWCVYANSPEIFGILEKKEASTNKYKATISNFEHGSAIVDKTEYAYGDLVTITVTPESGYAVNAVTVTNAQGNGTNVTTVNDTTYTFFATCVNTISVTMKDASDTKKTVVWNCGSNAAPSSSSSDDTDFTATVGSLGSMTFGGKNYKQNVGYVIMYTTKDDAAQDSYFYSKTAIPGKIVSITIKTGSNAATAAMYAVTFGTETLSTKTTGEGVNIKPGATYKFDCEEDGATYFQVAATGSKNSQIAEMTIVYDTDTTPAPVTVKVKASKDAVSLYAGYTETVTATVTGSDNKNVTWSSADNTIATVTDGGVITGVAVGTTTITVTSVADTTVKATIAVTVSALPAVTNKTIAELLDGTGLSGKTLYRTTGIIEGLSHTDPYGNAYLTDAATGKTIKIYGLTGTDGYSCFDFNASSDSKFFNNPKDAKTSLANVNNGESVTVRVGWNVYSGVKRIFGVLESHNASTSKYTPTIPNFDNGDAELDKNEYSYGETATVTITTLSDYVVDEITVTNTQNATVTVTKINDTKYSFPVSCVNKVTITTKNVNDTTKKVTWDCTKNSAPTTSSATDSDFAATVGDLGSITFGGVNYCQMGSGSSSYIMMYAADKTVSSDNKTTYTAKDSYFYNKTAVPGTIKSVSVKTSTGASANASYTVSFGTSALSTKSTATTGTKIGQDKESKFDCTVDSASYFQIAITNGTTYNGQIVKITIAYEPSTK